MRRTRRVRWALGQCAPSMSGPEARRVVRNPEEGAAPPRGRRSKGRRPTLAVASALLLGVAALAPPASAQAIRLGTDEVGRSSQKHPQVVRPAAGGSPTEAHVIWEDMRLGKWMISHQELGAGGTVGPESIVSMVNPLGLPTRNATEPVAAVTAAGTVFVAWHSFGGGQERVMASVRPSGLSFQPPVQLNLGRPSEYSSRPDLTLGPNGTLIVAWAQSDGAWDQVHMRVRDPVQGWLPTLVLTGDADPNDPPVYLSDGHHEGVRIALDDQGNVVVASLYQEEIGQRRVRVFRGVLDGLNPQGVTFNEMLFVDTEHSYGCPGSPCNSDEAAFLDLAVYADPLVPANTVHIVSWVDLTQDPTGLVSTYLKASHSVGGVPFSVETNISPFNGPLQPYYLENQLAAGVNGRIHALYGRVDAPYCFLPFKLYANRFDPDFVLQTGAWGGGNAESSLSCDSGSCGQCGPPPAVFGPPSMCGPPPGNEVVKGFLPLLPRASLEGSNTGTVVATWMESVGDNMGYGYVTYARSNNDGLTWSMAKPLTTPGNPGGLPGTPGSARAGHADIAVRGGNVVTTWDDRRNWTDPDDPPALSRGAPDVYVMTLGLQSTCSAPKTGGTP